MIGNLGVLRRLKKMSTMRMMSRVKKKLIRTPHQHISTGIVGNVEEETGQNEKFEPVTFSIGSRKITQVITTCHKSTQTKKIIVNLRHHTRIFQ